MNLLRIACATSIRFGIIAAVFAGSATAKDVIGAVSYSPTSASVEGNMPYTQTYVLNVTSPSNLVGNATIGFVVTPTTVPYGDVNTAATYVSFSPSQLVFSGPSKTIPVTVTFSMPDLRTVLPADVTSVFFSYQITTSGWPVSVTDTGHSINARATVPPIAPSNPPVVSISTPSNGTTFTYNVGALPATIPLVFAATSTVDYPILIIDANLSGPGLAGLPLSVASTGLGTASATGTASMTVSAAGSYTVQVRGTNSNGTTSTSNGFVVQVNAPAIVITDPYNGQVFTHQADTPALNIPFTFITSAPNSTVTAVSATLDGVVIPSANYSTTGLGTATATTTGTMLAVSAVGHNLTASGTTAAGNVSTSVSFSVVEFAPPVPPTVVITSPPLGASYPLPSGGSGLTIPLIFTGSSQTANGKITVLAATLDGTPLTVVSGGIGQQSATGTVSLFVVTPGVHTIVATATDQSTVTLTTEATRTFEVTSLGSIRTVSGTAFFDVNFDGVRSASEPGLAGVSVALRAAATNQQVAVTLTNAQGVYTFGNVATGTYVVVPGDVTGLSPSTLPMDHTIVVGTSDIPVPPVGYGLRFSAINGMKANGYSHGYWKNNLEKALAGKTGGTQVTAEQMLGYTLTIASLALPQYAGIQETGALAILSANTSDPSQLLSKQLIASEYNYASGGYINGSERLTYWFIYWGETVLQNSASYPASYLNFAQQWFDAYNNTHGGAIIGPLP